MVRSLLLDSGLFRLIVGRDVVERRGFTAIVFQGFLLAVAGILAFSTLAGVITARRVLKRIDTINATSSKIMSGNLSERIPVTKRNDEFDVLATSLNAMLDRIEGLMQGLKEVTDNVAHDLKTPLTRLRNRAEAALRDGGDGTVQRQALETTLTESDGLIRTFNALLMIARAEAGAPSGAFADVDVSAVAADVAELYEPVAEEAAMTLESRIQPGVRLRANRELIGQALVNLIENALKYYEPAEGKTGRISRRGARRTAAACGSRSATTARAFPPRTASAWSSASCGSKRAGPRLAPASACRWSQRLRGCTRASSASRTTIPACGRSSTCLRRPRRVESYGDFGGAGTEVSPAP